MSSVRQSLFLVFMEPRSMGFLLFNPSRSYSPQLWKMQEEKKRDCKSDYDYRYPLHFGVVARDNRREFMQNRRCVHDANLFSMKERPRGRRTSSKQLIVARAIPLLVFQPLY